MCSKLHNYCLCINQHGEAREIQVENAIIFDWSNIGITPMTDGAYADGNSRFGYFPTWLLDNSVDIRE